MAFAGNKLGNHAAKLDMRAKWLMLEWARTPTVAMLYADGCKLIRMRFGCGKTAAEKIWSRAKELQTLEAATVGVDFIITRYLDLYERSVYAGKFNNARAILDSLMDRLGHSAPARMAIAAKVQAVGGVESPHMRLLDETPQQRRQRLVELRAERDRLLALQAAPANDDQPSVEVDAVTSTR